MARDLLLGIKVCLGTRPLLSFPNILPGVARSPVTMCHHKEVQIRTCWLMERLRTGTERLKHSALFYALLLANSES